MAIVQATCLSYKTELLQAIHNFAAGGDAFYIALYTSSATLDENTTAYSATNEASGTGYTAGGQLLATNTLVAAAANTPAYAYWTTNPVWTPAEIPDAAGALIYNSSKANRAICTLSFGGTYASGTGGTFQVILPTAGATTAIVRVA